MPQPTTAEVRLEEHKAASFGPAGRASCRFGFQRVGCDRISLPRNPQGRKIATNNFGIREMSVEREALVKTPKFFAIALATAVLGAADGALAEQVKNLFFEGDLVRHTLENQKGPFCVLTSQFKRKEAVAWRIRVLESTGDVADDKVLKSVVVELGDGQKFPARYGPHPPRGAPPTDYFWSVHWEIPADYPTGSLGYKVIATMMDDRTQTWEPFTRTPSQLTVIAGEPEMKN
jgi:hypothetical protein